MEKNAGQLDRTFRIVLGLIVIALGVFYQNWLGVIGLIPLATGFAGFCPLYRVFGFSTCQLNSRS